MSYIGCMSKKQRKADLDRLGARVNLRITAAEKEAFLSASKRQGISISQWMRLAAWVVVNEHQGKVKLLEMMWLPCRLKIQRQ